MRVRKKKALEKKKQKTTDQVNSPLGDSFIPSMKSQNGIFLDGALVGAGSLKPDVSRARFN